jgi:FkbM family methyltransferase
MMADTLAALTNRIGAWSEGIGLDRLWRAWKRWRPRTAMLRMERDLERMRLFSAIVISPTRAITQLASGDRIYVDPRDRGCGLNLMTEGRYEEDELRFFRRLLRPGATVLDIGANYGYYSLCSAPFVRPGGQVIAFEPNPHIHALFADSIHHNGYSDLIAAHCIGVSDAAARLAFEIDEYGPGGAHIVYPEHPTPASRSIIEIPVVRLDEFLPAGTIADVVKIDVEGNEEKVLRGMRGIIARSPDIFIFMEFMFVFLSSEEAFERLIVLITDDLGLRIHRVLSLGQTAEVTDPRSLRGTACSLILAKSAIPAAPELTMLPSQLTLAAGAMLAGDDLVWRRPSGDAVRRQTVAYGPYLYLPRGRYRLEIDGDFDGPFLCRVLRNGGELLWEARVGKGRAR